MNSPARRFSLTKILAPQPEARAVSEPAVPLPKPATRPPAQETFPRKEVEEPAPKDAASARPAPAVKATPPMAIEDSGDRRHPKKKRSYSVDMGICDDLELIAWYQRRSSSSIVEELMKKYVASHREMLEKARAVHAAP